MSLYIGCNYHPHDWAPSRWRIDVNMMKEAGFTTVRLGHLCWDSYEPDEGVYTFEWFDEVMDLFAEAGIGVVLDISMHPAPLWVHRLCRGCNIGGINGDLQYPVRRYMEDVSDPAYQYYALRFAKVLVNRYKDHPALFAFGLCNELGWCHRSYSEESKARFINWLRRKYGTIDKLNRAWATQRWCRRLREFDEVGFPETEKEVGSPEAWLDMRRFFSDGIGEFICSLQDLVKENAPGIATTSNHYAENSLSGFDYMKYWPGFVDYPGLGYYFNIEENGDVRYFNNGLSHRIAETDRPMWCIEYQTGGFGLQHGAPGLLRMMMLYSLLGRTQMILGWTWRSMLGGEEQFLFGLLDHDGEPNVNFETYVQVAKDFRKLEAYAFPYLPTPEIGAAHSYDADWAIQYPGNVMFRQSYFDCMQEVSKTFYDLNADYNIVDLKNVRHHYKLLLLPDYIMMTQQEADWLRQYVSDGGSVIMTGYSAMLDENGQVFSCTRPGLLNDLFGIRISGFERPDEKSYFETIELRGAEALKCDDMSGRCLVSCHAYGKGKAYYTSAQMDHLIVAQLIREIAAETGISLPVKVPHEIQARAISDGQFFFVNTSDHPVRFRLPFAGKLILHDTPADGEWTAEAYDADLLVADKFLKTE